MKTKKIRFIILLSVLFFAFVSCDINNKLNIPDAQSTDTKSIEDNTDAELTVINVFQNIYNYGIYGDLEKSYTQSTDTNNYVIRTINNNKVILDFSLCDNQKGKIIIDFSDSPTYKNTKLTGEISFENYSYNNMKISGTGNMKMTHSIDTAGPNFTFNTDTLKFFKDNKTFLLGGKRDIIWKRGFQSLADRIDDEYLIYGNTWGINSDGIHYNVKIEKEKALKKALSCEYITEGEMTLTDYLDTEDEKSLIIDFAPGEDEEFCQCDSWLTITVNGFTFKTNIDN
ncbi:MAG: hypothetical protein IMY72_08285 [Bacteroidetes bacterium]|nr:hypothetical protein [Bacteroidota bacterium]